MKKLIPLLFIISVPALAQRSPEELKHLKASSPYCVNKLEEIKGQLYWSISNSCYMLRKNLSKRDLASVPAQAKSAKLKQKVRKVASASVLPIKNTEINTKIDSASSKVNSSQKFNVGLSANHYSTDVNASSLATRIGYEKEFSNSFEAEAFLEVEKYVSVDSSKFQAEINKPVFNGSLIGLKKLERLNLGAELGVKHYIQVIDNLSIARLDMTPFLSVGAIGKYALTDKMNLGTSASYLKASDNMDSKGYELKAFGSYSFGTNQKYAIIPHASITKLENSFTDITNNKLSVLFQVSF